MRFVSIPSTILVMPRGKESAFAFDPSCFLGMRQLATRHVAFLHVKGSSACDTKNKVTPNWGGQECEIDGMNDAPTRPVLRTYRGANRT
jgi:hypothetical protein